MDTGVRHLVMVQCISNVSVGVVHWHRNIIRFMVFPDARKINKK